MSDNDHIDAQWLGAAQSPPPPPRRRGHGCGLSLTIVTLHTTFKVVSLNQEFRVHTRIDAVAGSRATEIVVQHMNLANTSYRHALFTAFAPPVEGKGCIQIAWLFSVTIADKIGILVHIGMFCITKGTPADGNKICLACDIEIAIHTIHKRTVVYPAIFGTDT